MSVDTLATDTTTQEPQNGLQALARMGVPDSAITALLIAITTLTVLPHLAGREIGPYSVPDVLSPGVFWTLALATPVVWVALFSPLRHRQFSQLGRSLTTATTLMLTSGALAFASSTTTESRDVDLRIQPGAEAAFLVDLPAVSRATQRLDVTLVSVTGTDLQLPPGAGVAIGFCGADASAAECKFQQIGTKTTLVRRFEKGAVRIAVFNFQEHKTAVDVRLRVSHLRRRLI